MFSLLGLAVGVVRSASEGASGLSAPDCLEPSKVWSTSVFLLLSTAAEVGSCIISMTSGFEKLNDPDPDPCEGCTRCEDITTFLKGLLAAAIASPIKDSSSESFDSPSFDFEGEAGEDSTAPVQYSFRGGVTVLAPTAINDDDENRPVWPTWAVGVRSGAVGPAPREDGAADITLAEEDASVLPWPNPASRFESLAHSCDLDLGLREGVLPCGEDLATTGSARREEEDTARVWERAGTVSIFSICVLFRGAADPADVSEASSDLDFDNDETKEVVLWSGSACLPVSGLSVRAAGLAGLGKVSSC
jgi:hypothetical protein